MKINVPEGMLGAAHEAWCNHHTESVVAIVRYELEAALGWLAENPIRPTDQQAAQLWKAALELDPDRNEDTHAASSLALAWQRMMFTEQEAPEERVTLEHGDAGWILRLDGKLVGDRLSTDLATYARIGLIATLKQDWNEGQTDSWHW
jgi:hypothetical protein